jgi:3-deoxy-D-manno-octulosonic-acid transferase
MFIFYDLIFLIFAVCYLPVFLFKKKLHAGFGQRLGNLAGVPELDRPIWIHAVSVGEAMSIKHLLESLKKKFPEKDFVISTVTPTGNKIAKSFAGKNDVVIYLPLDLSWIVRRVVRQIDPSLFIIVETEIWPNLITCFYKNNIPMAVVNARISDRSFKGYLLAKFVFKPLLNKIGIFCVQSGIDAERLAGLGVDPGKIIHTGNMKFDIQVRSSQELKKDYTDYRHKLGIGPEDKFWVAASTHPQEEEQVLEVYLSLSSLYPELKLLIAPRHPERSQIIEELINSHRRLKAYRVSGLARFDSVPGQSDRCPVFILDTIGKLINFYVVSDIVFVGGSLVEKGGHNILEPASLAKPVIFGKYMFNFRDIAEMFVQNNAGIMVNDLGELEQSLKDLLDNPGKIIQLAIAGQEIILKNQGATARNAEEIRLLADSPKYGKI